MVDNIQISSYIFCAVPESEYGAVAYLLSAFKVGTTYFWFVMRKFRFAPTNNLAMQRLESKAAVIGIKFYSTIVHETDCQLKEKVLAGLYTKI